MTFTAEIDQAGLPATLTQAVYSRLKADILSAEFRPGVKLKVAELCARYDVGASPVREVLSRLSSEALVEKTENRGFRVAPVGKSQYLEIYDLRCLLEGEALRRSIANASRDWEDKIMLAFYRLDRTPIDRDEWENLHRQFHLDLLGGAGSHLLLQKIADLYDQAVRYRNLARQFSGTSRDVRGEHNEIFEAAMARDVEKAITALHTHYRHTLENLPTQEITGGM